MNELTNLQQAQAIIKTGKFLIIAGDEKLLRQLPKGNWIGGTTPYFMGANGGVQTYEQVFITELPSCFTLEAIDVYDSTQLSLITSKCSEHGITFVLMPAFSQICKVFEESVTELEGIFVKNIAGWVSGFDLSDANGKAWVFNGKNGEAYDNRVVVMHTSLPADKIVEMKTANVYRPNNDITITFEETSTEVKEAIINGQKLDFAKYIKDNNVDLNCPMIANFFGNTINVSFQSAQDTVKFFAPVYDGVEYHFAYPVDDYYQEFEKVAPKEDDQVIFSCNCALNYTHGKLKNRKTGQFVGPITFGEIAHQVLNQSLVYITLK